MAGKQLQAWINLRADRRQKIFGAVFNMDGAVRTGFPGGIRPSGQQFLICPQSDDKVAIDIFRVVLKIIVIADLNNLI